MRIRIIRSDEASPVAIPVARPLKARGGRVPLFDAVGHALGVLCAADSRPREWSPDHLATRPVLADRASGELVRLAERRSR